MPKTRRESFTFSPFCRLIFSANLPPQSPDSTDAFFDRWIVVPFTTSFVGCSVPRDKLLPQLTAADELSGLLNRALAVLPGVLESGITETESMKEAALEFREVTDPVAVWLSQACIEEPDAFTPKAAMLEAYNRNARAAGHAVSNRTAFGIAVRRAMPGLVETYRTVGENRVWVWQGVGLKTQLQEA